MGVSYFHINPEDYFYLEQKLDNGNDKYCMAIKEHDDSQIILGAFSM
jgi:hypothetical protein